MGATCNFTVGPSRKCSLHPRSKGYGGLGSRSARRERLAGLSRIARFTWQPSTAGHDGAATTSRRRFPVVGLGGDGRCPCSRPNMPAAGKTRRQLSVAGRNGRTCRSGHRRAILANRIRMAQSRGGRDTIAPKFSFWASPSRRARRAGRRAPRGRCVFAVASVMSGVRAPSRDVHLRTGGDARCGVGISALARIAFGASDRGSGDLGVSARRSRPRGHEPLRAARRAHSRAR